MGKYFAYIIAGFFLTSNLVAQTPSPDAYQLKRKPGLMRYFTGFRAPDKDTPVKFDRLNTNINYNNWVGDENGVKAKPFSLGFDGTLMFDIPFGKNSPVGIGIGIGYSYYQIFHNGNFSFGPEDEISKDYTLFEVENDTLKRRINKFSGHYIELPFEFRLRLGKDNKFKFYPGFKIGYLARFTATWRYSNGLKFKEFNFPDASLLRYGPTLRIGFNNLMIYGHYSLPLLFTNNQSFQMNPFSIGISIGWF